MGFHTIITLSYLIPGIYIFIRVWQMFIPRKFLLYYLITYGFLFAVYPLSNMMEEPDSTISTITGLFSGYLLAFFLYIFLSVLVTDVMLLLNFLLKIVPLARLKNLKLRNRYFVSLLLISALVVAGGAINFNTIRASEYSVSVPARSTRMKRLRIAFVSDFHLERSVSKSFVSRFVKRINEENPDILLYGGDIVEGRGEGLGNFEKMLGKIHPRYGVYGIRGNHDRITRFRDSLFPRTGIEFLRDTVVIIENAFSIAGRDEAGNHDRLLAEEIASKSAADMPLIMLDHRPTDADQISKTHTDIAFSGHTHNGQLFPLNFYLRKLYKLSHGYMRKGNTHFFVSSGIRLWGPRVRTTGKSEIMIVDVDFK